MARQTRAQRRARRAEQARGDGAAPQRTVPQAIRPAPPRAEPTERQIPGGGVKRFVSESWAELKKVEWPKQPQLIQGVAVVLIACLIVGVFLYASDLVFKRLVENVFLGQ